MNKENDVILAILKLSRAMRRCAPPPFPGHAGPGSSSDRDHFSGHSPYNRPLGGSAGRMLACIAANPHVSSRDLCEILDLRPSSLSEMLARAESDGWITRTVDEADRRIQRVDLSPKGKAFITEMEDAREKDAQKKTACFTEEEKSLFCTLCNRLSEHLESLAQDLPAPLQSPEQPPRRPFPPKGRMRC